MAEAIEGTERPRVIQTARSGSGAAGGAYGVYKMRCEESHRLKKKKAILSSAQFHKKNLKAPQVARGNHLDPTTATYASASRSTPARGSSVEESA